MTAAPESDPGRLLRPFVLTSGGVDDTVPVLDLASMVVAVRSPGDGAEVSASEPEASSLDQNSAAGSPRAGTAPGPMRTSSSTTEMSSASTSSSGRSAALSVTTLVLGMPLPSPAPSLPAPVP